MTVNFESTVDPDSDLSLGYTVSMYLKLKYAFYSYLPKLTRKMLKFKLYKIKTNKWVKNTNAELKY